MGQIKGVVRKKSDNSLVEGAIVTFTGYDKALEELFLVGRAVTNAQGEFEFNEVNTGEDYEYEGTAKWDDNGTLYTAESIPFVTVEGLSGFVTEWQTTTANESIELPLADSGTYDFTVHWGDGSQDTITAWDDAAKSHEYAEAGTYEVQIVGQIWGWNFDSSASAPKIYDVKHWGEDFRLGEFAGSTSRHFRGCTNLNITADDVMPTTGVTGMMASFMDTDLTTFNRVNDIDMSNITVIGGNLSGLFQGSNFNHDVNNWDVSSVTQFGGCFRDTPFNSSVEGWTFNVAGATCRNMFHSSSFNNPSANGWDVSNITDMSFMFHNTPFNQNIGSWVVSSVENMESMFFQSPFNQNIGSWVVSSVENMESMFRSCPFNQDIGSWNVSSVTTMRRMFWAGEFNQDISGWDVSSVGNFENFLDLATGNALSTANYDALLIAWEQLTLQTGITADFGNAEYSSGAAATARQSIIDTYTWTINDGGQTA